MGPAPPGEERSGGVAAPEGHGGDLEAASARRPELGRDVEPGEAHLLADPGVHGGERERVGRLPEGVHVLARGRGKEEARSQAQRERRAELGPVLEEGLGEAGAPPSRRPWLGAGGRVQPDEDVGGGRPVEAEMGFSPRHGREARRATALGEAAEGPVDPGRAALDRQPARGRDGVRGELAAGREPRGGEQGQGQDRSGPTPHRRPPGSGRRRQRETDSPTRTVGPLAMLRTWVAPSTSSWRATPRATSTMRPGPQAR